MTLGVRKTEVQFIVERPCPHAHGPNYQTKTEFPFVVKVWWPAEARSPTGTACPASNTVFRVTDRGLREAKKATKWARMQEPGACVCEHMGHVIE